MARHKSKKNKERKQEHLTSETKRSIIAVLLIGLALILMLASFNKAGPAGGLIYSGLSMLLGWGYYLLPFVSFLIAGLFLLSHQKRISMLTFVGASLFIVSGLGLIDILLPEHGGILGKIIGGLEIPFGFITSIVLTGTFLVVSLLITLNASIPLRRKDGPSADGEEKTKEITEVKIIEPAYVKKGQEVLQQAQDKKKKGLFGSKNKEETPETPTFKPINKLGALKSKNYNPPPASLLKSSIERPTAGDLRANANIIKRTLESFGIPVEMGEISIGPKVTRYTLKPAEGIKLARIIALNQDLSLALAAHPIRIEAPIPSKSLVGIEIPNKSAAIVHLGSLMAYPEFTDSGPISFVLGRDVSGKPIAANIDKMPHLLVAGSTGSGKSIAIHSMLISLLYKNSPETLKLILIDPKRVELSIYNGIPHLIAPVITDGKKAVGAFRWAIKEMERRYEVLLRAGVKDIGSYNKSADASGKTPLPYILIVIDELADLMAAYGREIEGSIVRLAQMARATGLHLIVATQRPSVEVITGLIKANITSRMALQVASQVDSRTILDSAGAEKLLGGGDMLFISAEFSKPKRIQGAYVSEKEIQKVVKFIKENNDASQELDEVIDNDAMSQPSFEKFEDNDAEDELYNEALHVIMDAKKASASLLQRRLKIGYARAARLLDIMEAKGIVGPADGAKPREVYGLTKELESTDE